MALQNAFGDLALEETLKELRDAIGVFTELMATPQQFPLARDSTDRLRVLVEGFSPTPTITAIHWGSGNTYPVWYGSGSPNSMDAREVQREASMQTMNQVISRWVVT